MRSPNVIVSRPYNAGFLPFKKARGRVLRFVVLEDLARARILADPDPELLEAAYAEVSR